MSRPANGRSRRGTRARAHPPRFRGVSYGGWSFRERTAEIRAMRGLRDPFATFPILPPVWGVRLDIRPLGLAGEESPSTSTAQVPRALRVALDGVRELRGELDHDSWQLFRDGQVIGWVSRPVEVPLCRLFTPSSVPGARVPGPVGPVPASS